MRKILMALVAVGCVGSAVAGGAVAQGDKPGRYTMSPADGGGFVRLDTETGLMSLCQRRDGDAPGSWACRDMADADRGLSGEIDRLRSENQRLKAEMKQMEDIFLGEKRAEQGPPLGRNRPEFRLPSEQDIDEAMSYAQRMLRKFREKLKDFEVDGGKGTPL